MGEQNVNGIKLIEFAGLTNLKIANSFFYKKDKMKWTWISPNSKYTNEIDHFLINDMRIVQNVTCLPAFKFSSDHRMCRSTLKIESRARYNNNRKDKDRTSFLIIPEHKKRIANEDTHRELGILSEKVSEIDVQETYNAVEKTLLKIEKKYDKENAKVRTDDKLTENTKNIIKERNKLSFIKNKNTSNEVKYCELCKLAKRMIKEDVKKIRRETD